MYGQGPIEIIFIWFSLLFLGIIPFVIAYLIINRWVNRSMDIRKEQNDLLRKLIQHLETKNGTED